MKQFHLSNVQGLFFLSSFAARCSWGAGCAGCSWDAGAGDVGCSTEPALGCAGATASVLGLKAPFPDYSEAVPGQAQGQGTAVHSTQGHLELLLSTAPFTGQANK